MAPQLFRELGFDVTFIGDAPDGRNINLAAGRPRPRCSRGRCEQGGFRLGVAFDGDGDRAIFVDTRAASWTATPSCSCARSS